MNLFNLSLYNIAILCPYKITYLLHSISILPSKYILRWKYILRNKNQLNLSKPSACLLIRVFSDILVAFLFLIFATNIRVTPITKIQNFYSDSLSKIGIFTKNIDR